MRGILRGGRSTGRGRGGRERERGNAIPVGGWAESIPRVQFLLPPIQQQLIQREICVVGSDEKLTKLLINNSRPKPITKPNFLPGYTSEGTEGTTTTGIEPRHINTSTKAPPGPKATRTRASNERKALAIQLGTGQSRLTRTKRISAERCSPSTRAFRAPPSPLFRENEAIEKALRSHPHLAEMIYR